MRMSMRMAGRAALFGTAWVVLGAGTVEAQRGERRSFQRYFGDPNEFYVPPDFHGNTPYDGRFTFARIKYRGYARFMAEGPGWSHDYPRAEENLMKILREVTSMRPFIQSGRIIGGNIVALDDPDLFRYPVAYLSEPGGWTPNDAEVRGMRDYFLKGGFVIFDDFAGQADWLNTVQQMRRVLPEAQIVPVEPTHPIFDSFYQVELSVIGRPYGQTPEYLGIYEGNDPKKRLIAIFNLNNDIGEFWQWSGQGFVPIALSNEAFKLGVNYIIYALTH